MMKIILRPLGVYLCALATKKVILKHKPIIYVITGSGETSLVRESLYIGLKELTPTRRNLEKPEAEFSIPLTIFGEFNYPKSLLSWIIIYIQTLLRIFYLKSYQHTIIIEINSVNQAILDKWLPILNPDKIFVIGNISNIDLEYKEKTIYIKYSQDIVSDITEQISGFIATTFTTSKSAILEKLSTNSLPTSRINFAKSKFGNIVIDASYFQFPPSIQSVEEIIELFPGPKKLIGQIPESWKQNAYVTSLTKIDNFKHANKEDVLLLVGNRTKVLSLRKDLFI